MHSKQQKKQLHFYFNVLSVYRQTQPYTTVWVQLPRVSST